MTGPDKPGPHTGTSWAWLLALPILSCAGPSLLAAVGAGSLTAALGGVAGSLVLLAAGAAVLAVAVAVLGLRRRVHR